MPNPAHEPVSVIDWIKKHLREIYKRISKINKSDNLHWLLMHDLFSYNKEMFKIQQSKHFEKCKSSD